MYTRTLSTTYPEPSIERPLRASSHGAGQLYTAPGLTFVQLGLEVTNGEFLSAGGNHGKSHGAKP